MAMIGWTLNLSTVAVIFASSIVIGSLGDSCHDLESISPCAATDALLKVSFGRCGVGVIPDRAKSAPSVTFMYAKDSRSYLLVMVDLDAPSSLEPKQRYWRHWVVSDISGSSLRAGSPDGYVWTVYNGPTPPAGSGPHRYQLLLFEQPGELHSVSSLKNDNRGKWQLIDFVRSNGLCDSLVSSYEFVAENKK